MIKRNSYRSASFFAAISLLVAGTGITACNDAADADLDLNAQEDTPAVQVNNGPDGNTDAAVVITAAEERTRTAADLQAMRTTLVAELEALRLRLNDGTLAADTKAADTQRASELAQGLERLDRTILEIDEANDDTWPNMRDRSVQATEDLRQWMVKYGMSA